LQNRSYSKISEQGSYGEVISYEIYCTLGHEGVSGKESKVTALWEPELKGAVGAWMHVCSGESQGWELKSSSFPLPLQAQKRKALKLSS